jgi:predicted nucleotidyltransferase
VPTVRPSQALKLHRDRIREIALSHRVTNVRVFGSVVTGEDTEESDLDILVDPTHDATLMDIARIQAELSNLLQVNVDVLTPNALPERFRQRVLDEAQAL